MHSKVLLSGVLAALTGISMALPVSVDVAETGTTALNGTTSDLDVTIVGATNFSEPVAQMSSRDGQPKDWSSKCAFQGKRTPGSVIDNTGNQFLDLVSDCVWRNTHQQEYRLPYPQKYILRISISWAWAEEKCVCDWFHFYLKEKSITEQPKCTSWADGTGIDINFTAGRGKRVYVNWAIEQTFGIKSICREAWFPKDKIAGHTVDA